MKRIRTLLQLTVFVQIIGAVFATASAGSKGFGNEIVTPAPSAQTSTMQPNGSKGFGNE